MFLSNSSVITLSPSSTVVPSAGSELTSTGASTLGMSYCASVSLQAANPKVAAASIIYDINFFIVILVFKFITEELLSYLWKDHRPEG